MKKVTIMMQLAKVMKIHIQSQCMEASLDMLTKFLICQSTSEMISAFTWSGTSTQTCSQIQAAKHQKFPIRKDKSIKSQNSFVLRANEGKWLVKIQEVNHKIDDLDSYCKVNMKMITSCYNKLKL